LIDKLKWYIPATRTSFIGYKHRRSPVSLETVEVPVRSPRRSFFNGKTRRTSCLCRKL